MVVDNTEMHFHGFKYEYILWLFINAIGEWHRTILMTCQHWFRKWLGAIRQQAIFLNQCGLRYKVPFGISGPWLHSDVIMRWHLKSPASRLFTQPCVQVQIKTSKLHVTGHCEGNSPVTGGFPTQRASNVENISIWWHQNDSACVCVWRMLTDNTGRSIFMDWNMKPSMSMPCKCYYDSRRYQEPLFYHCKVLCQQITWKPLYGNSCNFISNNLVKTQAVYRLTNRH